ncbi:hypothetical protein P7C70_g3112, partial [Phenoliferia sp. Uapishka_3]
MNPTHSLRARTHPTYVDDDSDGETFPEPLPPAPKSTSIQTVRRRAPLTRKVAAPTPLPRLRRLKNRSPPTSPSLASRVFPSSSIPTKPSAPPRIASPDSRSGREKESQAGSSSPESLVNHGLHFLFSSSDNWIPFLHAWKQSNALELSRFAADVANVSGYLTEAVDTYFADLEELAMIRAEARRRAKYKRYAIQRDARRDVRNLARRWSEEFGSVGPGDCMEPGADCLEPGADCLDVTRSGEGVESSDESESEDVAVGEYLICW